jgi:hypothetical protein
MSRPVAIATADRDLFVVLRMHLANTDYPGVTYESIEPEPLAHAEAARDWLDAPDRTLLVIDAELPPGPASPRDRFSRGEGVRQLQKGIEGTSVETTPRLVITPSQGIYRDVEATCTRERRAIALSMEQLRRHRQNILRPFLAMLLGKPDASGAIPGTFRVVEVDFHSDTSRCALGFDHGPLLQWEDSQRVQQLRKAAQIFDNENFYKTYRWPLVARQNGELLFTTHVIEALGEELFGHIEYAAGGLEGLAFRYLITDESLYLAPFEASVRPMGEQDGPFVLLHAPLARKLPVIGSIRAPRVVNARMPIPARVLFIRSQMGEHPDGPTTGDNYILVLPGPDGGWKRKPVQFVPLGNLDLELAALREIACKRPGRLVLDVADLSNMKERKAGETAADYIGRKLTEQRYDIVHYAGHAWSDNDTEAHLILPGAARGEASGLSLSTFAGFQSLADARLLYLSACRGISKRTVQKLVAFGIPQAIGFRYQVEDDKAALFASAFYEGLFDRGFVCTAFRAACAAARQRLRTDDESPIWLSPVLLAQAEDWAMRA